MNGRPNTYEERAQAAGEDGERAAEVGFCFPGNEILVHGATRTRHPKGAVSQIYSTKGQAHYHTIAVRYYDGLSKLICYVV